jgi:hypothetical protein
MIPYRIKFLQEGKDNEPLTFESNEKPVKGDTYTIQRSGGKSGEVKIVEVTKVVVPSKGGDAVLEYHCKVEKHEAASHTIGFGKR